MGSDVDRLRLVFTYTTGLVIVVGTFALLGVLLAQGQLQADQLLPFLAGILASVLTFVFQREGQVNGQRSAERAFQQGADAATGAPR